MDNTYLQKLGLLYVHRKREDFLFPFTFVHTKVAPFSHQFRYISSLFLFCIFTVTSRPSYLAWKGEERRTQKTQTYTTYTVFT